MIVVNELLQDHIQKKTLQIFINMHTYACGKFLSLNGSCYIFKFFSFLISLHSHSFISWTSSCLIEIFSVHINLYTFGQLKVSKWNNEFVGVKENGKIAFELNHINIPIFILCEIVYRCFVSIFLIYKFQNMWIPHEEIT